MLGVAEFRLVLRMRRASLAISRVKGSVNISGDLVMVVLMIPKQLPASGICLSHPFKEEFWCLRKFVRGVLDIVEFVVGDVNGSILLEPITRRRLSQSDGKSVEACNHVGEVQEGVFELCGRWKLFIDS